MNLTRHRFREKGIVHICFIATLVGIFYQETPFGPPGGGGNIRVRSELGTLSVVPKDADFSGTPNHPGLKSLSSSPTLSPVAQDLRVSCGLACKDNTFTLLHGLWLNGQGHCRGVCKVRVKRSFLSVRFLFPSHLNLRPHHSGML